MAIAVQSVQTATWVSASSVTITKPTGLSVGDLMVAVIAGYQGATPAPLLPAGWTSISTLTTSPYARALYKIADASDVAASNFAFTATAADRMAGVLYRIDGFQSPLTIAGDADEDINGVTAGAFTFTKSLTPLIADALVISAFVENNNDVSNITFGTYTLTGSPSFSERLDAFTTVSGASATLAVADAEYDSLTEIVSAGATLSDNTDRLGNIVVLIYGAQDTSGTATLLQATPTIFTPTSGGGTSGTAGLLTVSPTFPAPTSEVETPKWTNVQKNEAVDVSSLNKS